MMCVCVCIIQLSLVFSVLCIHIVYMSRAYTVCSSDNDADIEGVVWAPHIRGLHECAYVII